ncbi:MAG: 30S ribosomal protein S6 [Synergistetes bacterium]|nr:30S ribosomal protein S6 [Synergistota bacterium]MCX8127258.1 30S ribosomal protein S6 [Synergistota bacterium]MDW8191856.1 30S ribosomal protein S6 [Synergistota bacterium]
MRKYEMMVVFDPALEEEALKEEISKVEDLIRKGEGNVEKVDLWGRRRLAYPVNKKREGIYAVFYFQVGPESLKEIDRVMKIDQKVMRFMIVKRED